MDNTTLAVDAINQDRNNDANSLCAVMMVALQLTVVFAPSFNQALERM